MAKVVLIPGASSGIGKSVAVHLGKKGYKVYGASRSAPDNEYFDAVKMDVSDHNSVMSEIKNIIEKEGRIDVLINNAGKGSLGTVEQTPIEDVKELYELNVFGLVNVCQEVLPVMRKQRQGMIINVSSLGSSVGMPFRSFYSASKASVDLITESLRLEVANFGIQACTVHPGDVSTNIASHRVVSADLEDPDYGKALKSASKSMDDSVDHGKNPDDFGPLIEKIVNSRKVKRSYFAGSFIEELGIKLKKYLPYYMYEAILKKYFSADG